jgi:transposase
MSSVIKWVPVNTILSQATCNGWNISRHLEKKPYQKDEFLYVATKDGQRRIVTKDWNKAKKEILKSTELTLL